MIKNNRKYQQSNNKIKSTHLISEKKNSSILFIIIVLCFPVLLYLQTIKFDISTLDDKLIISDNISFLSDFRNASQAFLTDAFTRKIVSFYRPLQTLSYMVDIQLSGGNNTWMYHLSNILVFGLISFLLFLLLRQFLIPPKLAFLSTLIYCAHPLFTSFVAWIPARGDLLLTFFSILSFLFFIKFLKRGKIIYLFLNWASFTIALFCKETSTLLPIIFIIYYLSFSSEKYLKKKYLFNIILYAVSGIFWFWLRSKAIGGFSNRNDAVGLIPLLLNLRTIPESLTNFFLPFEIDIIPLFSIFKTLAGIAIIFIIITIFFRNREKLKKEKIFCFSWFLILMLPPMLYKDNSIDYFNHRFFLPMISILLFVLFIFPEKWFEKGDINRYWLIVTVVIFLSSFTFVKSRSYSNLMTFYNSAVSQNPNSVLAINNRGNVKLNMGDNLGAIEDYNKAIAINPRYDQAYYNIGVSKENMGDKNGAIEFYSKAIAINPRYFRAYHDRGVLKANIGDNSGAISDYNKAIAIYPKFAQAYGNRGLVKANMGDKPGAIEDYNNAITINPEYAEAYNNKGAIMFSTGNLNDAINNFNKAIKFNPKFWQAYENRAVTKYNLHDIGGAIEDCEYVLKLNPNDEIILNLKTKYQQELHK